MNRLPLVSLLLFFLLAAPVSAVDLPPAANHPVSFAKEIAPLLQKSCVQCHAKGKDKGGFSLETRESFLKGGDSGAAAELGKSGESYLVELVAGLEPDDIMPKKGSRWTPEQVGLLRAWIDQGMPWDTGFTFAKPEPLNLKPRKVEIAEAAGAHPLDVLLAQYAASQKWSVPQTVDDARFARRAYLDIIGLLPTPAELEQFVADPAPDKRSRLAKLLLSDSRGYAEHWLTFWNDLLRNDYKGTGFIDGGRRQVSGWLYNALLRNLPYDQFVRELVNPDAATEGFAAGILWRGTVNASMTPPMQAAQNVSQVFMGVNLKCAACHDSFINDWALADAYGMAAVYSDDPLELVHCDKPTGKQAALRFLYPELGALDAKLSKPDRLKQFAEVITSGNNGRLTRTVVNRIWAQLMGRGLVEDVDDMEKPAWSPDMLDWLAEDLAVNGFNLKRTIELIVTSRAYQLPAVEEEQGADGYTFQGPRPRRLTAEQFSDAVNALGNTWAPLPSSLEFDLSGDGLMGSFSLPQWVWTDEPVSLATQRGLARVSKARSAEADAKAVKARQLAEAGAPEAAAALTEAAAAAEEAKKALDAISAAGQANDRHRVVLRHKVTLAAAPSRAYATALASQSFDLLVNGEIVKPALIDNARNGRVRLFNLAPRLKAGENIIALSVSSHTEKGMNDTERRQYPQSTLHLNARPGVAFYARYTVEGVDTEVLSGPSWRVRRAPDGDWGGNSLDDSQWRQATLLPANAPPVDEGPGLVPIRRKDFANRPVELAPALRPAVSIAAMSNRARAAMLAADSLALALDRPNREQVTTTRLKAATTMQSLELTNGTTLDSMLRGVAAKSVSEVGQSPAAWLDRMFVHALSRKPAEGERAVALSMLGDKPQIQQIEDTLWGMLMLPEFQIIQ